MSRRTGIAMAGRGGRFDSGNTESNSEPVFVVAIKIERCCDATSTPRSIHQPQNTWAGILFDRARFERVPTPVDSVMQVPMSLPLEQVAERGPSLGRACPEPQNVEQGMSNDEVTDRFSPGIHSRLPLDSTKSPPREGRPSSRRAGIGMAGRANLRSFKHGSNAHSRDTSVEHTPMTRDRKQPSPHPDGNRDFDPPGGRVRTCARARDAL